MASPQADYHRYLSRAPRHLHCHRALAAADERLTEPTSTERTSDYARHANALVQETGADVAHTLPAIVKEREQMSMRWVEAYARSVTERNYVPGSLIFAQPDESLDTVGEILRQFSGSAV